MQKRNRFWWVIPFTIGILLWGVWSFVFSSTPLKEGSKAPDFTLVGSDGNTYRLSDYRGKRVVLMFYPKSNTPGCTAQNCAIRDQYEKLSQHAVVFAISVDAPETQKSFAQQHNLKHIVLADADGKVAEAYQVRTTQASRAARPMSSRPTAPSRRSSRRRARATTPTSCWRTSQARAHSTARRPRKPPRSPKSASAPPTSPYPT
jgi:peroxiredoxin